MKTNIFSFGLMALAIFAVLILPGCVLAAENGSPKCPEPWEVIYSYSDDYSTGGIKYMDPKGECVEVARTYASRNPFSTIFLGKIKIVQLDNRQNWYGPRIAIINPENNMQRYEIRLYPNTDKLQVNYVDRTNRTGEYYSDKWRTVSEVITTSNCEIRSDVWYHMIIMRNGDGWNAMLVGGGKPTCFVQWTDDRIEGKDMVIGIQSAGKYVVSQFNKILAI